VLPPVRRNAKGESFVIVACTDTPGAEVMIQRIKKQMKRDPEFADYGIAHIASRLLQLTRGIDKCTSKEIEALTSEITRAVSQAMDQGESTNEQSKDPDYRR